MYGNRRGGGRFPTDALKVFKKTAVAALSEQWSFAKVDIGGDETVFTVVFRVFLPEIFNAGVLKKGSARSKTLLKRIDTSGLIKAVEDQLAKAIGRDDVTFFTVHAEKHWDPRSPRTELEVYLDSIYDYMDPDLIPEARKFLETHGRR